MDLDRVRDLDLLRPEAARDRERDRRSPCLSRMDRDESRDDLTEEVRFRTLWEGAEEQHLTNMIRKMMVEAKPRIQPV